MNAASSYTSSRSDIELNLIKKIKCSRDLPYKGSVSIQNVTQMQDRALRIRRSIWNAQFANNLMLIRAINAQARLSTSRWRN